MGDQGALYDAYRYAGIADVAVGVVALASAVLLFRKRSWLLAMLPIVLSIASQIYSIFSVDESQRVGLGVRVVFGFLAVVGMNSGSSASET